MSEIVINDYIKLRDDIAIDIKPGIVPILRRHLSDKYHDIFKNSSCEVSLVKLNCLKYPIDQNHSIYSAPLSVTKAWANQVLGMNSAPGLESDYDVKTGSYEGGFKVWECSKDLMTFIYANIDTILLNCAEQKSLKILELGAGACLPSICLFKKIMNRKLIDCILHLHDYNWQVLATSGLLNFFLNLGSDIVEKLLDKRNLEFLFGDWKDFESTQRYHLIMMSETLYNSESYNHLHNILSRYLLEEGTIIVASKNTYFGCSGDLQTWLDFVATQNVFHVTSSCNIGSTNIPRSIVTMKRIGH